MKTLLNSLRLLALSACLLMTGTAMASFETACGSTTWDLWAGQTHDVGSINVRNDSDNLYVTYQLDAPGATFGTVHLWVGNDLTNLPRSGGGAPINGQFPYSFDIAGGTSHTFTIPLADLNIVDIKTACPSVLHVVAHAEVNVDSDGDGVIDHETAYGGDIPGSGSRWWFYADYNVCCEVTPPPQFTQCETAFAKGGFVFTTTKTSNPEKLPSLNLSKNRWGWAINLPSSPTAGVYNIYAGAGLNDITKGAKVGTLSVDWNGSVATINYSITTGVMEEIHIFASDKKPTTVAPGQYGYTKDFEPPVTVHSASFNVSDTDGDGIWIIAHAVSCR